MLRKATCLLSKGLLQLPREAVTGNLDRKLECHNQVTSCNKLVCCVKYSRPLAERILDTILNMFKVVENIVVTGEEW